MFKKEFRERQEYLKQNGPRKNFSFTNENYFPLKVEYIDLIYFSKSYLLSLTRNC